jgi:hypothetical protein
MQIMKKYIIKYSIIKTLLLFLYFLTINIISHMVETIIPFEGNSTDSGLNFL